MTQKKFLVGLVEEWVVINIITIIIIIIIIIIITVFFCGISEEDPKRRR